MSYNFQNESDDSLNQLFTKMADFNSLSQNLIRAKDINSFVVWFDKLYQIDKRTLYFFLCKHYDEFDFLFIDYAQRFYKKNIQKR